MKQDLYLMIHICETWDNIALWQLVWVPSHIRIFCSYHIIIRTHKPRLKDKCLGNWIKVHIHSQSPFIQGWQITNWVLFSVRLALMKVASLFYYSAYFCYYSWALLYFLMLFIDPTVLFQLTFTFIYNTFSNKFLVSAK